MIFNSLLAVVLLSPLPLASNRPWSWSLCALLIACISVCSALSVFTKNAPPYNWRRFMAVVDICLVFILVLAWSAVQALWQAPMEYLHPLWDMTFKLLGSNHPATISLAPDETLTSIMRLLAYGLTFWLAYFYCQHLENAQRVVYGLMLAGVIYCVYGLVIYFGDYQTILWFDKFNYLNDLTSTFISRNHFATYAGLTLLCAFTMLTESVVQSSKYHIGGNIGLQRFLEQLVSRSWGPLLAFFIIGTALLLTHSRGGFFSSVFGLGVLLLLTYLYQFLQRGSSVSFGTNFLMLLTLALIFFASLMFFFSSDGLMRRLDDIGLDSEGRIVVYDLTWQAIQSNPWIGFGLGSFKQVFPLYKTLEIGGSDQNPILWDYAHNTYLECAFELGIPAALGLFYCIGRLALMCIFGAFRRKRNMIYPALGFSATVLIAAHASVDFSMQIPAVPLTYMLLMGAACAQTFNSNKRRESH